MDRAAKLMIKDLALAGYQEAMGALLRKAELAPDPEMKLAAFALGFAALEAKSRAFRQSLGPFVEDQLGFKLDTFVAESSSDEAPSLRDLLAGQGVARG